MAQIINIKPKLDRINGIRSLRDFLNLGISEAKNQYDNIITDGVIDNLRDWEVGGFMLIFDGDYIPDEVINPYSNQNIREPMPETLEALAWLKTLTEKEQEMVKLIGDWENPPNCYAAVC